MGSCADDPTKPQNGENMELMLLVDIHVLLVAVIVNVSFDSDL